MKVAAPKKRLVITIFTEAFKELSIEYFESKFHIRSPLLK